MREGGREERPGSNGGYSKWVAGSREREKDSTRFFEGV